MIYTSSIIDGFKVVLGALTIQMAMLVSMLVCVRVNDLDYYAKIAYTLVACTHAVMIAVGLMHHWYAGSRMFAAQLNILAMVLQLTTILYLLSNWVFGDRATDEQQADEAYGVFTSWLRIEVMVFFSYIAANMLWLFVRSLVRNWEDFCPPGALVNEKTDYLESNLILMSVVESFVSPTVGSLIILSVGNSSLNLWGKDAPKLTFSSLQTSDNVMTFSNEALFFVKLFFVLTLLQSIFSFFINFATFYVYQGNKLRNQYMIYVHYVLVHITVVVIPIIMTLLYAWFFVIAVDAWNPIINAWLLVIVISSIGAIFYYILLIRGEMWEIREHWHQLMENDQIDEAREKALKEAGEESVELLQAPDPPEAYVERNRGAGLGPLRIGMPLTFKEDIYSLLFIANVKGEYKDQCYQDARQRVEILDKVIQDYNTRIPEKVIERHARAASLKSNMTVEQKDFGAKHTPDIFIERSKTGLQHCNSEKFKYEDQELTDKDMIEPKLLSPDPVKQDWVDDDHQADISLSAHAQNQAAPFNPNVKTINRQDRNTIKSVMSIPDEDDKSQLQLRQHHLGDSMSSHQHVKFPSNFAAPNTATKADLLKRRYSSWNRRPKSGGQSKKPAGNVQHAAARRLGPRKLQQTTPGQISERGESQGSQVNMTIQSEANKAEEEQDEKQSQAQESEEEYDDLLDPLEQFRTSVLGRVTVLFIIQSVLSILVILEALRSPSVGIGTEEEDPNSSCGNSCKWSLIVIARFICGIVMHVSLQGDLMMGMQMMKYSVNHTWKFTNWQQAFLAGFLQTVTVVLVELVNLIAILHQDEIIDLVMDFMALVIISAFGNYFYAAVNEHEYKDIITQRDFENYLIVQTTTSSDAKYKIAGNQITLQQCELEWKKHVDLLDGGEDKISRQFAEVPKYIKVDFSKRSCCNKFLYSVYKMFRIVYVTFWFYFMPFSVIFLSYMFQEDVQK